LDAIGLVDRVFKAVANIAAGRKGLATDGEEHEGRISYEGGLASALAALQEALASGDPRTMVLIDHAYVAQERQFCDARDAKTLSSLRAAAIGFDDSLNSLTVVADAVLYRAADKTHSHNSAHLIDGMPVDVFHDTCRAHRTRLTNTLRSPGINMLEKAIHEQRIVNMSAAQDVYLTLQKGALGPSGATTEA
jgi:hypothetical protein